MAKDIKKDIKKTAVAEFDEVLDTDVVTEDVKPSKKMANPQQDSSREREEIDALKKQLDTLQSLLIANSNIGKTATEEDGYIRADRSIQVMSLTPHLLNLSTQGNGRGKIFRFHKYGETKNIIYSDLSDILIHYNKLAENGAFYIFDKEVIKRHGLEFVYQGILDKKGIDSFLEKEASEIKTIFANLTQHQKLAVVQSIVNRIVDGEDVSTNKVSIIKDLYGEDIFAMAEEMKNWETQAEELSK